MSLIELVDSGIVYRNPKPAVRSAHGYFPTLVELPTGELLAGMDIGSAFEAVDVRSYQCRSSDGGANWSRPELIFQPDESRHRVSTTCRIGQVGRGELLGWACLFDRSRIEEGLGNPAVEGFCETSFATVRSFDGGKTWTAPQPVALPTDWRHFETCAPPFHLGDGRLLTLTSPWASWDGKASPWGHDGLAFLSDDNGHTWTELIHVFRHGKAQLTAYEQALTRLSDSRLAAMCWTYDRSQQRSVNNRIAFSADGRSFGPAIETPLHGETCRPLGLRDNRLLVVYRRVDEPGLWAHLAQIEGDRWIALGDRLLWNGLQGSQASSRQGTVAQMSVLQFGCPAILQRQSGEIFVAFWCVEQCVSNIRWLRLRVAE